MGGKINDTGAITWQNCYGGSSYDVGNFIEPTRDGGYIIAGGTMSDNGTASSHYGATDIRDAWLIKITSGGTVQWQKNYGGSKDDLFTCVRQVKGGGYIAYGITKSNDFDVPRGDDTTQLIWVVKTDNSGGVLWSKTFPYISSGWNIMQAADSSFIIGGVTNDSYPTKDMWVASLNSAGDAHWEKIIKDSFFNGCTKIIQPSDKGFAIATYGIVVKLGPYSNPTSVHKITKSDIQVYPNPTNGKLYIALPKEYEDATIKVMNMMGVEVGVYSSQFAVGSSRKVVSLENLPTGMYLLHVVTESGTFSYKVMYQP